MSLQLSLARAALMCRLCTSMHIRDEELHLSVWLQWDILANGFWSLASPCL